VADFTLLPGELNLRAVRGDEWNIAINLQRDVSNYAWESYIYQSDTITAGGGAGSLSGVGTTITQPTIGISNASTGAMVIGLTETQTKLLSPTQTYRWYLRWVAPGDVTRTIISGSVTAVAP
jgi:hypothetical protein